MVTQTTKTLRRSRSTRHSVPLWDVARAVQTRRASLSNLHRKAWTLTFYASEPKAPGQTETLHLVGLPAGGRICTQLGVLDDYAAARLRPIRA